MNITVRKLAMIEKDMERREAEAKLFGYTTSPVDNDLKDRITKIMDKVRVL